MHTQDYSLASQEDVYALTQNSPVVYQGTAQDIAWIAQCIDNVLEEQEHVDNEKDLLLKQQYLSALVSIKESWEKDIPIALKKREEAVQEIERIAQAGYHPALHFISSLNSNNPLLAFLEIPQSTFHLMKIISQKINHSPVEVGSIKELLLKEKFPSRVLTQLQRFCFKVYCQRQDMNSNKLEQKGEELEVKLFDALNTPSKLSLLRPLGIKVALTYLYSWGIIRAILNFIDPTPYTGDFAKNLFSIIASAGGILGVICYELLTIFFTNRGRAHTLEKEKNKKKLAQILSLIYLLEARDQTVDRIFQNKKQDLKASNLTFSGKKKSWINRWGSR